MNQQRIKSVTAEAPSLLLIDWRSEKRTKVKITEYLISPGYERLADPEFFVTAVVEEWGHGVEWADGEIGIDADTLYRLGKEQAGFAFPVNEFNAWMEHNGLSLTAAANALGISRLSLIHI